MKNELLNISDMENLTFKNTVYINELKQNPNGRFKRSEVDQVMRHLHFYS
jgi:hypothetical protein